MKDLENKNILVTGASGGIGNSIIQKLNDHGANILASGTRLEKLEELKNKFNNIKVLKFDISQNEKIEEKINSPKKSLRKSIISKIETLIQKTAQRRTKKKKENKSKSELIWDAPEPSNSFHQHEFCSKCQSVNPPNTNYCSSCGSYLF